MAVPWAQIGWRFATGVFLAWVSRQSDDSSPEGTQHRPIKTTVSETVGPGQVVLGTARVGARKAWASASDYTREYRETLGRWNRTNNEQLPVGTYRRVSATQIDLHGITADAASTGGRTIYDRLRALAPYGPERQEDRFTIWINGAKYTVTAADAVSGQAEVTRISVTPNLTDLPATINIDVGAEEKGRRAEFVYAISHGKCDGSIGKVWVNGDMHSVTDAAAAPGTADGKMYFVKDVVALGKRADLFIKSNDPTRRSDLIQIFSFSKADGKEAQVESDLYRYPEVTPTEDGVKDTGWGTKQKGYDISYLHVWIYQPAYSDDFNEANVKWQQYFDGEPEFEFEYKGRSFWWPGQADGVDQWTESAAAINYLIDTEYTDIPAQYINVESVKDAHDVCSERLVNTSIPENWPARYKAPALRYSVNGVIRGSDTHERIRSELDFAWAGKRIVKNGEIHYRPGANRAPVATIDKNNSTPRGQIAMSPPLDIRLNSATVTLAQSALDDFRTVVLPGVKDQPAIDNDGETFHRDLGTRLFVNNPVTAARLTTIWLRLARDVRRFPRRVQPGEGGKNYGVSITDRVVLDVIDDRVGPDYPGLGRCVLEARTIEQDGGLVFFLGELQNIYDDAGVVPPVLGPDALFTGRTIDVPTGVGAREESIVQRDGLTLSNVIIFWGQVVYQAVQFRWRLSLPAGKSATRYVGGVKQVLKGPWAGRWTQGRTRNNSTTVPVPVGFVIEFEVRSIDRSEVKSDWSPTGSLNIDGILDPPSDLAGVVATELDGRYRLMWNKVTDPDYSHTRILHYVRASEADVAPDDPPANAIEAGTAVGRTFVASLDVPLNVKKVFGTSYLKNVTRSGVESANWVKVNVSQRAIQGTEGEDGAGLEVAFKWLAEDADPMLPASYDDWLYDRPQDGWTDGSGVGASGTPWLQRIVRTVPGIPEAGDSPLEDDGTRKDGWGSWKLAGRWRAWGAIALPPPAPVTVTTTAGPTPPPGISGGIGQWSIARIKFPAIEGAIGYRIAWEEHWSNGEVQKWSTDQTARSGEIFRSVNRGNDLFIERWVVQVYTLAPGYITSQPSLPTVSGPGAVIRAAANSSTTVGGNPQGGTSLGTDAPGSARVSVGDGEVVFRWDDVLGATAYRAQYREVGNINWLEATGEVCCEVTIDKLKNGTEYEFRVQVSDPNEGDWTTPVRATPGLVSLDQITGMIGSNPAFGHVTISWNALSNAQGYELQYGEQDVGFTFAEDIKTGSSFSSTDALRRTFIFRCRGYLDVSGERQYGAWSETLIFAVTSGRAGPPTAPRNLRFSFGG